MGIVNTNTVETFGFYNDPIVIRKYIAGLQGGVVLDVEDFTEEYIKAGHIVIYDKTLGVYKPLGVAGGKYVSLPSNCSYEGVVVASKSVTEPLVGVMYSGEVNDVASPFPITEELKTALKAAIPTLVFKHD